MHNNFLLSSVMCGLCCVGGSMGYLKKGSKVSLIAGGSVGIGFGIVAYSINNAAGNAAAIRNYSMAGVGLSALLFIGMGMRAMKVAKQNNGNYPTVPTATALMGLLSAIGFFFMAA